MERFVQAIVVELLPNLQVESQHPFDPIVVHAVPSPWQVLGAGNYAVVLTHPGWPDLVAKVYAPGRPGIAEEAEVYRRLGRHPAYSELLYAADDFLILRRLRGTNLWECLRRGIPIPEQVIRDIDDALAQARALGLHPHDVHAKNVMMLDGRGLVVDISDFLKEESCSKWEDLKKAYYRFYLPYLFRHPVPIPHLLLTLTRKGYRLYSRFASAGSEARTG